MEKIVLSGDRPTGPLHIGHYVGSLNKRVELQNSGECSKLFMMIADTQELISHTDSQERIRNHVAEVAIDYMACGLNPEKSIFFVQSQVKELFELTCYFLNLVTLDGLRQNPTVKSELSLQGFHDHIPAGFLAYPVSQAADIATFKADLVTLRQDQLPLLQQTREIVRTFNRCFGEVLTEPEAVLPSKPVCSKLPGTDGKARMRNSFNNCIYLSDSPELLKKKIMAINTDPSRMKTKEPGFLDRNPVFAYLDAFCGEKQFKEFLPDYRNLEELKEHFKKGGINDVKIKNFLFNVLLAELEPIRSRRQILEKDKGQIYGILQKGSKIASEAAAITLDEVRKAMKIDYFNMPVVYFT